MVCLDCECNHNRRMVAWGLRGDRVLSPQNTPPAPQRPSLRFTGEGVAVHSAHARPRPAGGGTAMLAQACTPWCHDGAGQYSGNAVWLDCRRLQPARSIARRWGQTSLPHQTTKDTLVNSDTPETMNRGLFQPPPCPHLSQSVVTGSSPHSVYASWSRKGGKEVEGLGERAERSGEGCQTDSHPG